MVKLNTELIEKVRELKNAGYAEADIAKMYGLTTIALRKKISEIHKANREILMKEAHKLKEEGKSIAQIARELGKNESSVRLLLDDAVSSEMKKSDLSKSEAKDSV